MARSRMSSVFKGGLSEKTISERSGGGRDPLLVIFKDGEPKPFQFVGDPTDEDAFKEFDQHIRRVGRSWEFVPCIGDGCLACESEDEDFARTSYAMAAQVWSFKDKKMMVLSGGTNLAQRIVFKYKGNKSQFLKRAWDITRLATAPKSFDVSVSETARAIRLAGKEPCDLDKWLRENYSKWAKKEGVSSKPSTLDEDDEDDEEMMDEEDIPTRKQMLKMEWSELKRYAKSVGVTEKITRRSELIDAIEETLEEDEE